LIERLKGWAGRKLKGITLFVDIIDTCSFGCPTCPVGVEKRRDGNRMSIGEFREILDKAQLETKIRKVQLYRWCDPLLHPDLHLFIKECRKRNLRCATSSALKNWNCDIEKVIEARPDEFRISFSGWKNLIIYQKGNTNKRFFENFERLCKLPKYKETVWTLYFHQYKDNLDETERARELAESNGLKFVAFPAQYMLYDRIVEGYKEEDKAGLRLLIETPQHVISKLKVQPEEDDFCRQQNNELVLDSHGRVQLCQMMYGERFIVGDFLEPLSELRKKIVSHKFCKGCKASGVPKYSNLCYADPVLHKDPHGKAVDGKFS
jgi:hypothetical protein